MWFESLEIWKIGQDIALQLWVIFYHKDFKHYWFQDQIMRAVISISNNIAEWYERYSPKEKKQFLYYAKWSAAEVRNMIYLSAWFWYITIEKKELYIQYLKNLSVKIQNFINTIKD